MASVSPFYGGPARSVTRMADALTDAGHEVGLWAPDGSVAGTAFLREGSTVRRMGGGLRDALDSFPGRDVHHDNGIWLPHNHAIAEATLGSRIPRIVSTRGMLDSWCRRSKRWKKDLAWFLYQRRDLETASVLHATADQEAAHIRTEGVKGPIAVIPNGVDLPEITGFARVRPADGPREALFVGRIYPVKGLPMLIEAWHRVRPSGWKLRIVGSDEEGHRAEVEQQISRYRLDDEVILTGPLEGEAKRQAYEAAELFVLPTYSENFGMAIAEALAHGLPVLTTKGAPWPMLEEAGCGWWVEPTPYGIERALRIALATSSDRLREMGDRGRQLVAQRFQWNAVARQMTELYEWVRGEGEKPEFVIA